MPAFPESVINVLAQGVGVDHNVAKYYHLIQSRTRSVTNVPRSRPRHRYYHRKNASTQEKNVNYSGSF